MPEYTRPVVGPANQSISIRDVPADLWRDVKTVAARNRQTIRDFVIVALRRHVDDTTGQQNYTQP